MRNLVIIFLTLGMGITAYGAPMPEQYRTNFIKGSVQSCLTTMQNAPLSKHLTDVQRIEYCNCAVTRAADAISLEDLQRVIQTKSNEHLQPVMQASGNYCMGMLSKKWGYQTPTMATSTISDADYIKQYSKNYYASCFSSTTTGDEAVSPKLGQKICTCSTEKITKSLKVTVLKEMDANPSKYINKVEAITEECVRKAVAEIRVAK